MNRLNSLGIVCVLAFSTLASIAAETPDYDETVLLEMSGAAELYSKVFESMNTGFVKPADEVAQDEGSYFEQFNNTAKQNIARLSYEDRRELFNWYQTPLGKEISRLYAHSMENIFADKEQMAGMSDQKIQLIADFVEKTKLVDSAMRMSETMLQSMEFAMNTSYQTDNELSDDLKEEMEQARKDQMRGHLHEYIVIQYSLMFKNLNQDEILLATQAMSSEAYRHFESALQEAYSDVLAVVFYEMAPELAKMQSELKKDSEDSDMLSSRQNRSCSAPFDDGINHQKLLD